ncbi:ferredoxin family 2Fe-2S iron-sulfur cluster binding protein [Wolbachia endosymbiont of Howardula sp.]|uniref:ferredoxin family 2Fe-2S iron-sulfur cluster binding protein n=1 Tax=Wolbachia endosymbiont of Howardula sp. TaxID=2916816 RepID=UPI00217F12A9|nr:ferredoxin family 2Fe-2S iron-sulfur cluster binding protein [Wolbachia endosymbiont of Howardula sp.]UWI83230.1 ferredoxin family 2Fe-2S iron-sulfur cluster binding protein [Wolbachia endosymbiont of Howardula sp.]
MISITFILPDGSKESYEAIEGETILELAHRSNRDLLEGACEGALACSTCHIIIDPMSYNNIEILNPLSDEENDMLDLAFGLTETSRLGCQIKITKEINNLHIIIPKGTRNISLDR